MVQNKVLQNAKWIVLCKVAQSLVQLVIGMITARYLGPSNYGLINYAASIVAFAVPFMQLGMNATLVQEYVTRPGQEGAVAGTSLAMSILSGLGCIVGVVCFAAAANRGETETILVCALYSTSLLFQAAEMLQYWFQAKLLSKYSSVAILAAYAVVSLYKVILLVGGKSVYWFALSHAVEYGAASLLLLLAYRRAGGGRLTVSCGLAKTIVSKSRYYILASLMVTVFQNTDHVMLKLLVGDAENGFYTTAITCAGVAGFVYSAILDSARPAILEKRETSREAFEKNVTRLYSVVLYLTLAQSVCFTVLARPIVFILYGSAYSAAVPVLQVLVWQMPFSYMGAVRNIWILGEERYQFLWKINLSGALFNVLLNALMIPHWGAVGAALASVTTQVFTNFILGFFLKPLRRNNALLLQALHPAQLLDCVRMLTDR